MVGEPHDQLICDLWLGNPMTNSFVTYVCRTSWPTPLWLEVDEPHDQFLFDLWSGNPWPFLKGILSTSCVIFSYPKLLSISVLTFIKWRLTPSYVAKDTIFWQKRPKAIVIRIIVRMTIFKSIHMAFYANTSWACALFRNNKQHVVLGQKRNCQCVEESGLWRIQR